MFAPYYGIPEEAATGMAAGPLAAYPYTYLCQKTTVLIEQGHLMPSPSPSVLTAQLYVEQGALPVCGWVAGPPCRIQLRLRSKVLWRLHFG